MFSARRVTVALLLAVVVMVPLVRTQEARKADPRQWKIVFESERDGHREIYVMNPDGSEQQRLTHTPGTGEGSWSPRWSPDRTRVAFSSTREGDLNEIYIMDADGSNVQRLTHTPGKSSANPAWSPDGKGIAFESDRDGKSEICVMEADGSNVHRLTHTKGRDKHSENPDWSPDGKRIAFESDRDGKSKNWRDNFEIYVMHADGSNVQRLTFNQKWDGHPDW